MATIRKHYRLPAPVNVVWAAFADVGAVHTRLAPGFVTDTVLEPGGRRVTFVNGVVAFEAIVTIDPAARRLVYAIAPGDLLSHHNASFEVTADGPGALVTWTADILPDVAAPTISGMMDAGVSAMTALYLS